ncbi:MAG: methionyl aminopeptidase [Chlamydiae bacterium]|nr:methionyl aminopeptidase [Chlamydiota bacterium]
MSRNDPCFCGSGKKWKKCHYPQMPPETTQDLAALYKKKYNILLKTPEQIAGIRKACRVNAKILKALCEKACPGMTTRELDLLAQELFKKEKALSASFGYGNPPFSGHICTSLNDVICHGIPGDTPLKEGDILNIDVASSIEGYFGDCSAMVCIGKVSEEKEHVTQVAHECMMRAIRILKPGLPLSVIGETIETYATSEKCSVVSVFVSHGVGLQMHEEPQIPHNRNTLGIPLAPGMIFTIEPMINVGVADAVIDPKDKWTARTADGKPSAQWEHTVLITEKGYEILTLL